MTSECQSGFVLKGHGFNRAVNTHENERGFSRRGIGCCCKLTHYPRMHPGSQAYSTRNIATGSTRKARSTAGTAAMTTAKRIVRQGTASTPASVAFT